MTAELNYIVVVVVFIAVLAVAYSAIYRQHHKTELARLHLNLLREQVARDEAQEAERFERVRAMYQEAGERERQRLVDQVVETEKRSQQLVTAVSSLTFRATEAETRNDRLESELERQRNRNMQLAMYNDKLLRFFEEEIRNFEQTYGLKINLPTPPDQLRFVLLSTLRDAINLDELRSLCFQLDVNFENLGGEGLEAKIVSLLEYLERNGRLGEVETWIEQRRPEWRRK